MSIILKMKQEKGKTFNNISIGVNGVKSARNKLKQTTLTTPIKKPPLTAKVNSTWNNVLNKNKNPSVGKISTSNKFEINSTKNDPVRTLRFYIMELKNKIDILLPANRAVKNIMDNILKTFSQVEQTVKIHERQKTPNHPKTTTSHNLQPQLLLKNSKDVNIDELRHKTKQSDVNAKRNINEKDGNDSQLPEPKNESKSSKYVTEKLESTLNESVNTERETIANYEQQCKRLQNEIKTLEDSASRKEWSDSPTLKQKQNLDQTTAMNKFKHQTEIALKELETGKLLTMLKYDDNQMSTSYAEFCQIYELIQQYFSLDHSEQVQITTNVHSVKKK